MGYYHIINDIIGNQRGKIKCLFTEISRHALTNSLIVALSYHDITS